MGEEKERCNPYPKWLLAAALSAAKHETKISLEGGMRKSKTRGK
jgi:hypothetical protein